MQVIARIGCSVDLYALARRFFKQSFINPATLAKQRLASDSLSGAKDDMDSEFP